MRGARKGILYLQEGKCWGMEHPHDNTVLVICTSTQPCSAHSRNGWWSLQEGRVTFSQLICLAIIGFVGLQCMKLSVCWYDNWQLEETMQVVVNDASFSTDAAVINTVLAKARKLKVPLDPRDLHIERNP